MAAPQREDYPRNDRYTFQGSDGRWYYGLGDSVLNLAFGYDTEEEAIEALDDWPSPCTCKIEVKKFGQGGSVIIVPRSCPRHGDEPDPRMANIGRRVKLRSKYSIQD